MEISFWKNQVNSLSQEVTKLLFESRKRLEEHPATAIPNIQDVDKLQADFLSKLEYAKQLIDQSDLISGPLSQGSYGQRAQALFFWARMYTERLKKFWETKSHHFSTMMWMKLLKQRLTGYSGQAKNPLFSDEDLVHLSVRRSQLLKNERVLETKIAELKRKQFELKKRYQECLIHEANQISGRSLQIRFGKDKASALNSLCVNSLEDIFRTMVEPIRKLSPVLQTKERREVLSKNAELIVKTCSNLIQEAEGKEISHFKEKDVKRLGRKLSDSMTDLSKVNSRIGGTFLLTLIFSLFSQGKVSATESTLDFNQFHRSVFERRDISHNHLFGNLVCSRSSVNQLTEWQIGIYDAQVEVRILRSADPNQPLTSSELKSEAIKHARNLRFHGYSFGFCSQSEGWIAALPAPRAFQVNETALDLPISDLKRYCSQFKIDFSRMDGGLSDELDLQESPLDITSFSPGSLSLTCYSLDHVSRGPIMWYLVPIKSAFSNEVPFEKLFEDVTYSDKMAKSLRNPISGDQLKPLLIHWINSVRSKENLSSLSFRNPIMEEVSETLHQMSSPRFLSHDRLLLKRLSILLESKGLSFLGENRVKARTLRDIVRLLWISPRHRNLLLSKQGTFGSIAFQNEIDDISLVFAVAK